MFSLSAVIPFMIPAFLKGAYLQVRARGAFGYRRWRGMWPTLDTRHLWNLWGRRSTSGWTNTTKRGGTQRWNTCRR